MSSAPGTAASLYSELGTSTLLDLHPRRTSPLTDEPTESPLAEITAALGSWLALLRNLSLATGAAAGASTAAAGLALLLFLLAATSLAPASDTVVLPLALDFSPTDLVGDAAFLPGALLVEGGGLSPADQQQLGVRFLAPAQVVDVWAELDVPRGTGPRVAQVVAELRTLDGRLAAKSSNAVMLRTEWWSLGSLALSPLRVLGVGGGIRRLRVPLFHGYRERQEAPFMAAHVAVKARNPLNPAEVVSAVLKVRLRLGIVRRVIYWFRPRPVLALALGAGGLGLLLGGGATALAFIALLLLAGFGGGGAAQDKAAAAEGDDVYSDAESGVELSSDSGGSEASSSLLRDAEQQEAGPSRPAGDAAAAAEERVARWLPTTAGPADSAMGSQPSAAALRRRTGKPS